MVDIRESFEGTRAILCNFTERMRCSASAKWLKSSSRENFSALAYFCGVMMIRSFFWEVAKARIDLGHSSDVRSTCSERRISFVG